MQKPGFIYNGRVVAPQFHPEINEERIQSLIGRFGDLMANRLFVQKSQEILGQRKYLAETKEFMVLVLNKFEKIIEKYSAGRCVKRKKIFS